MKHLVLAIVVAVASVAHASDATEVSADQAKAWVGLFDKLVESVITDRNDCENMAAHITGLAVANQATISMARDARAAGKRLPVAAQQHMLDSMRRMVGALDKCGRDDKVAAAFHHLDLGGH
jgi:hypothetical protein